MMIVTNKTIATILMIQTDTSPLISAIIPAFNRLTMLKRAVQSILEQDYSKLELIVVNDCSTESLSEIQQLTESAGHRFIRLKTNSGPATARNTGRKYAKGEYLAFLDSDDYWLPKKISKQVKFHQNNPEIRISQCREIWYRNNKRVNQSKKHDMFAGDLFSKAIEYCVISSSSVFMKTSLYDEFGGYPEHFKVCEDYALWCKITAKYRIGLARERLTVKYGGHTDQLSKKYPAMDRFRVKALEELLEKGGLNNKQEEEVKLELARKKAIMTKGANNNKKFRLFC